MSAIDEVGLVAKMTALVPWYSKPDYSGVDSYAKKLDRASGDCLDPVSADVDTEMVSVLTNS